MSKRKTFAPVVVATFLLAIFFSRGLVKKPEASAIPLDAEPSATLPRKPSAVAAPVAEGNRRESQSKPPRTITNPPLTPKEIEEARSEMKLSLVAIYGAQKSFHAEYNRYSTDLYRGLGYAPEASERWSKRGASALC